MGTAAAKPVSLAAPRGNTSWAPGVVETR